MIDWGVGCDCNPCGFTPRPPRRFSLCSGACQFACASPDTHRVLVAATSMKERADRLAAGLGVVAAETGQLVLLARSDPTMGLVLPTVANANGSALTTVTLPGENVAQAASVLIDAGDYDFAVVAVPSVDSSPAALTLARSVDQTILVATVGVTHFAEARRAADLIRQAGGTVAASFLVPPSNDIGKIGVPDRPDDRPSLVPPSNDIGKIGVPDRPDDRPSDEVFAQRPGSMGPARARRTAPRQRRDRGN
jgi:hypothetical protein